MMRNRFGVGNGGWWLLAILVFGGLLLGLVDPLWATDPAPPAPPNSQQRTTLADLPPAAQYAVSAQFGRDDPAYHVETGAPIPQVSNPRQGLTASFSPTALRVRAGAIDWNLTLTGWGRETTLAVPDFNPAPVQAANRVEYTDGDFTAWYVNGPQGLQQGWTVRTDRASYAIQLRWEGPPDLLAYMELVDEDTGRRYPASNPGVLRDGVPVTMTAPVRHFTWVFAGQSSP